MLNHSQRTSLQIAMRLIEETMREIEARLDRPEEQGLMFEVRNDLAHEMAPALRENIATVYELIRDLRDRLGLPRETKLASRDIRKGLPQLWVVLQECEARRLGRYGKVDPALGPVLDPQIQELAGLMLELQHIAMAPRRAVSRLSGRGERPS